MSHFNLACVISFMYSCTDGNLLYSFIILMIPRNDDEQSFSLANLFEFNILCRYSHTFTLHYIYSYIFYEDNTVKRGKIEIK